MAVTPTSEWDTGTAEVLSLEGRWVLARCPFCQGTHAHARKSLGSASVLAACSTPGRPRAYSLPSPQTRKENR